MNQKLKGSRNFLVIYGAVMSGLAFLSLLTNLPVIIFGDPIILSLIQMPALLPVMLAYLFFGVKIDKIHRQRSLVFLWINILSLFWFLFYLAGLFLYTWHNKNQGNLYLSEANTIMNYSSPFAYAAAFIVPGIIILIKLRKLENVEDGL